MHLNSLYANESKEAKYLLGLYDVILEYFIEYLNGFQMPFAVLLIDVKQGLLRPHSSTILHTTAEGYCVWKAVLKF